MGVEKHNDIASLLDALGQTEEPMGVYYTDDRPETGFSPIPGTLPTRDQEARGEIDWTSVWKDFSCVLGHVWRARKKQTTAFFSVDQFGCLGGWDPSARPYLKTDELIFSVPYELYAAMLNRWPESFLTAGAWKVVQKKIARSRKIWGEE
ncbi:MAG: DUF169 domain-containing protein [Deltaproteobacteria bacterium]|nr:DUF169 domain-containing protein [Deltaproteobacteria bacterium]